LAKYTKLPLLDIKPISYFIAGGSLLLLTAIAVLLIWIIVEGVNHSFKWATLTVASPKPRLRSKLLAGSFLIAYAVYLGISLTLPGMVSEIAALTFILIVSAIIFTLSYKKPEQTFLITVANYLAKPKIAINDAIAKPLSMAGLYITLITILYVLSISTAFGRGAFSNVVGTFGGGQPITVSLVLRSNDEIVLPNIPMSTLQHSQPLCLILELESGMLVFNPYTRESSFVKSEAILSIVSELTILDCTAP